MEYDILCDLPGRMRVHCRSLRLDPECRLELNRWVSCHEGLVSAKLSARTGNLLVLYSRSMSRADFISVLGDLRLFEAVTVGERPAGRGAVAVNAVKKACGREITSFVKKALLPRPVQQALAGWKMGATAFHLHQTLTGGGVAEFLWSVAKVAAMALLGKSLIIRVLIVVVADVVDPFRDAVDTECRVIAEHDQDSLPHEEPSAALLPASAPAAG